METGIWKLIAIGLGLLVFGYFYNRWVAAMEATGMDRGFTAMLVVGGCLVTILGAGVGIGVNAMLVVLVCFGASGLPMAIGSWMRHANARRLDEAKSRRLAEEMLDYDKKSCGRVCVSERGGDGDED